MADKTLSVFTECSQNAEKIAVSVFIKIQSAKIWIIDLCKIAVCAFHVFILLPKRWKITEKKLRTLAKEPAKYAAFLPEIAKLCYNKGRNQKGGRTFGLQRAHQELSENQKLPAGILRLRL